MTGIFVVAANSEEAKASIAKSVAEQIPRDRIIQNFSDTTYTELLDIERNTPGFYAWGVPPSPTNIMNWLYMATGDYVLIAQDGHYRYAAEVLGRYENAKAARAVWGQMSDSGDCREYLFFLGRPVSIEIPITELEDWLPIEDDPFERVDDLVLQAIRNDFGSVARFLKENIVQRSTKGPSLDISGIFKNVEDTATATGVFKAVSVTDSRTRHFEAIIRRRGHPRFRQALLRAYDFRCAMSRCESSEVLEAALIKPYRGSATYHVSNGLLLRSDLHTLFDLGMISVDSSEMSVVISKKLEDTTYRFLAGRKIFIPKREEFRPCSEALDSHRVTWGL
jgi:hypothetical protein